ncbi:hypothetical protein HBO25_06245 [Pseudomonas nitroreducens]|nr:hypothetical protein [Pseudomonas nitroreducens]
MFEVTSDDISGLNDSDLRTLVARLAIAELRKQGCPISSVTAGGNQDAADGGLDVRVECPEPLSSPDFVPRRVTGFQVKKPDMPANAIAGEMRPKGKLRPIFSELAKQRGAYIIVSAQGSVADLSLKRRREAIREQLESLHEAHKIHTDFYDRERLATWANEYPGISAWVKSRSAAPLSGWQTIGNWAGTSVSAQSEYLIGETACLIDERSSELTRLTIEEGIAHLRDELRRSGNCVRLIGLSGLGKTRLVQALFESGVGELPLDPSLAIYTDYSIETNPPARDLARQLIERELRVILVVDNCNPTTHVELARICSSKTSQISLLTIEYDVAGDEPEHTSVFRMQAASPDLVEKWLKNSFPELSDIDRRTIADFSDGNFRVAQAIAGTIEKGESLGSLKSRELFERIFQQRNEKDVGLLAAAQTLSLLYSIDGESIEKGGELDLISGFTNSSSEELYSALAKLKRRGIAQSRGRWRAVLPHAISNRLASYALEEIPASKLDKHVEFLPPRMKRSLTRRIGFLHDSNEAQQSVLRWLHETGPFGNLLTQGADTLDILSNLAPVAPEAVLRKLHDEIYGPRGSLIVHYQNHERWVWARLIKSLAYEPSMFDVAVRLLCKFAAAEPENHNRNSTNGMFRELFHLYLSGTKATPEQRRSTIIGMANSADPDCHSCIEIAISSLLKVHHFSSSSNFEFGARPRDWGWQPKINGDIFNWYNEALKLATSLSPVFPGLRKIIASSARELSLFAACYDTLTECSRVLSQTEPWIEGWINFRAALNFNRDEIPSDAQERLSAIIRSLEPQDLLHRARATILSGETSWDFEDGEPLDAEVTPWERSAQVAEKIGSELAGTLDLLKIFAPELIESKKQVRALEFGAGLAKGSKSLTKTWGILCQAYASCRQDARQPTVLAGFMYQAHRSNREFSRSTLDSLITSKEMADILPYLQARCNIDKEGVARLLKAIHSESVTAKDFNCIANGAISTTPVRSLCNLITNISNMQGGIHVAAEMLSMRLFKNQQDNSYCGNYLSTLGRKILQSPDIFESSDTRDFRLSIIIEVCCKGEEGEYPVRLVCRNLILGLSTHLINYHTFSYTLKALLSVQPFASLDEFLLGDAAKYDYAIRPLGSGMLSPIDEANQEIIDKWIDRDPKVRFPAISSVMPMFKYNNHTETNELNPNFIRLLEHSPNKFDFLGRAMDRLQPNGWSGSLAFILRERKQELFKLCPIHSDVRKWVESVLPMVDGWIERESLREQEREGSFE